MKKIALFLAGIFSLALIGGSFAFAQPDITSLTSEVAGKSGYDVQGTTDTTLSETIGRIIRIVLSLVGTVFFVLMVYAGFLWMTAQGSEEKVEKAQGIIKMASIGLIITLGAYALTIFLVGVVALTSDAPVNGTVGPEYGTGGFWKNFGQRFWRTSGPLY